MTADAPAGKPARPGRAAVWYLTGSLDTEWVGHNAATLPDGRVLILGGGQPIIGTTAAAAVYSPKTGTWSAAPAMAAPRLRPTSTTLLDGQVLVAGGYNETVRLTSTEVFDGETGTWTPTGSLAAGREAHTATLLPDGRVLVVGGVGNGTGADYYLASAEIYDPATRSWSAAASLAVGRLAHTATLLSSGKVLVAGGVTLNPANGGSMFTASSELYDPATDTWSAGPDLLQPRYWGCAVGLATGSVLVAGGMAPEGGATAESEIYDPGTGSWTVAPSMAASRVHQGCARLASGKVLVIGGATGDTSLALAATEVFDPAAGTWSAGPGMNHARAGFFFAAYGTDQFLAAGGGGGSSTILASAEIIKMPRK